METSERQLERTSHPAVLRVAALLEQKAPELADEMMDAYREQIPSYAVAGSTAIEDAREWARGSVMVATGIVTGRIQADDFTEALTEVGRRRAQQGFPLHDVLLANLIATQLLWRIVVDVAPDDAEERVLVQDTFMEASMSLLQRAVTGLSAGYIEIEHSRVADEEHDMQTVVETLAGLREPDGRHRERAEQRGIDLRSLRWCIVARLDGQEIGSHVRALRRAAPAAAVGRIGRRLIAFLPGEAPPELDLRPAGIASADDPATGYRRASAALRVATHLRKDRVVYELVVPLAMVLAGPEEDRAAFVQAQLGPLLEDPLGDELIRSLDAFYRSGQSIAAASRELFVHRHTLEYRLSRIEAALNTDIRTPEKRMLLELALALREKPDSA